MYASDPYELQQNATSIGESSQLVHVYVTSWYENTYIDGPPHYIISITNAIETPQY